MKRHGSSYQFSKLLEDARQGYEIHQVNGIFSGDRCQWNAYINNNRITTSVRNLFKCNVRAKQTLSLRYEGAEGTTTTSSSTPTTTTKDTGGTMQTVPPLTRVPNIRPFTVPPFIRVPNIRPLPFP